MAEKFNAKTFNPEAFGFYRDNVPNVKRNELIKSKALRPNSDIRVAFKNQTGSFYATLPMFGNLGGDPINYDGQTDITAETTTTFERGVVVIGRSKAWVERDFSEDITSGVDFMSNVAKQVSEYWENVDQRILLAILNGVFAMKDVDNNNFAKQHTFDISSKAGDDGKASAATLNSAIQQASGDQKNKYSVVLMHSVVATNLENLNLITYLKYTDASGIERELNIGTWNGRLVLVDDDMPVVGDKYTTYIFGDGAFDFEDVGVKVPNEMDRDPAKNGGQDTLYTRQRKVIAPYGISFTKKNVASLSPTNAELEDGENWALVNDKNGQFIEHKAIPIARIISKG